MSEPVSGSAMLPIPRWVDATVAVEAPGAGSGNWAGAPSALLVDGVYHLSYRVRAPLGHGRGLATVIARSVDGVRFEPVAEVTKDRFGAESLERPALVRTPEGRWRLYVSCATPGSKHWWIDVLEADTPEGLADAQPRTVLPGDARHAVKDPVVVYADGVWHLWASVHPLDVAGHEDRMTTEHCTSGDGLRWTHRGRALAPRGGRWDARGVRVSAVVNVHGRWAATYDGRATAGENWEERTGLAYATATPGVFAAQGSVPVAESPHARGRRPALPERRRAARGRLRPLLRGRPGRRGARPVHGAAAPARPDGGAPVGGGPVRGRGISSVSRGSAWLTPSQSGHARRRVPGPCDVPRGVCEVVRWRTNPTARHPHRAVG